MNTQHFSGRHVHRATPEMIVQVIFQSRETMFYDNCRNSRALMGQNVWSICGQTYELEIRATRQRTRAGNSTICYLKEQIDVSF